MIRREVEKHTQTTARYGIAGHAIAIISGLSFALAAVTVCTIPFTNNISGARDFVVCWATGQQLAPNPYDPGALMQIERVGGLSTASAVGFMRNSPWALPAYATLRLNALERNRVGGMVSTGNTHKQIEGRCDS